MRVDIDAAVSFVATHGRVLDRRRLDLLLGGSDTSGVLSALDAYANGDGGYGWGLEPDLRSRESQPVAAMHALEVLAEVGSPAAPRPVVVCKWLETTALAEGAIPFALPLLDEVGSAPWWAGADEAAPSLQMTAQVAAKALVVARQDQAVAAHPWLAAATSWCIETIARVDAAPHAYELLFAIQLLDAAAETVAEAGALLDDLGRFLPPTGAVAVEGGVEGELLRPLDFAPEPDRPARRLFSPDAIIDDLDRLAALQQPDGGWVVDFPSSSPAAALEWRGYATVRAAGVLRRNGVAA